MSGLVVLMPNPKEPHGMPPPLASSHLPSGQTLVVVQTLFLGSGPLTERGANKGREVHKGVSSFEWVAAHGQLLGKPSTIFMCSGSSAWIASMRPR
jgi:hypothetical protein